MKETKTTTKKTMTPEEKKAAKEQKVLAKKEAQIAKEEAAKVIPVKKLPKQFKKTYTEKSIEKKLYKKIYIEDDKKYVKSLFKDAGKNKKEVQLYAVPSDMLFSKKEVARLKSLSKEIKKQKGRIRWVPLIASVAFVAAVIIGVSLTKNIIIRKVIVNTCESTFEAKCDLDYVNLSFIKTSFNLKGLQIANKNEPMKNLVSIGSMTFDFDLLQLLRARFVANELSILDVATNTDRTTSGDISDKLKAKLEKKKAKKAAKAAKKTEDSAFMKSLNSKYDTAMGTLKDSINGVFDQYNPETIIKNVYANLQTPEVAKKVESDAKALVEKYKAMPEQLNAKVETVKSTAEAAASIDFASMNNDPVKIKAAIETINAAYTNIQTLKTDTEKAVSDMKSDVNSAADLSKTIQNAITHDTNLVTTEINKITSLSLDDGKNFISGTFNTIGYQLLGKYYPYAKQGVDYLINAKNNNKSKEEKKSSKKVEKTKSTVASRAPGRTVYWKYDSTPKFWIKKAAGSGPNFYFDALDITNDMDKTGKPATGNVTLSFNEIDHKAKLVVDTRSASKDPLVLANYNCDKLPLSYPTSKMGDVPGVPGIDSSVSNLDFVFKVFEDEGFSLGGTGKFKDMILTTIPFEPEFASTIYQNVLSNVNSMILGVEAGFTESNGVNLDLTTDVDKQFASALSKEINSQLAVVKTKVQSELSEKINEYTNGALGDLSSFNDISSKITGYADYANNMSKKLDEKKKEAENTLTNQAKSAATDAVNKATDSAKNSAKDALKKLF